MEDAGDEGAEACEGGEGAEELCCGETRVKAALLALCVGDEVLVGEREGIFGGLVEARGELEGAGLRQCPFRLLVLATFPQELAEHLQRRWILGRQACCAQQRLLCANRFVDRPPRFGTDQQVRRIVDERIVVQAQDLERRARLAGGDQIACNLQWMRLSRRIVVVERVGVVAEVRHGLDAIRDGTSVRNSRQRRGEPSVEPQIRYTSQRCLWWRAPGSPCR